MDDVGQEGSQTIGNRREAVPEKWDKASGIPRPELTQRGPRWHTFWAQAPGILHGSIDETACEAETSLPFPDVIRAGRIASVPKPRSVPRGRLAGQPGLARRGPPITLTEASAKLVPIRHIGFGHGCRALCCGPAGWIRARARDRKSIASFDGALSAACVGCEAKDGGAFARAVQAVHPRHDGREDPVRACGAGIRDRAQQRHRIANLGVRVLHRHSLQIQHVLIREGCLHIAELVGRMESCYSSTLGRWRRRPRGAARRVRSL